MGGWKKVYPPTQKATPACRSALRRASTVLSAWMNALRVPYEAHKSAVGCASEGSACLREAASAKAGPTKHVEEPRASARGGSTFQMLQIFCCVDISQVGQGMNHSPGPL